MRCWQSWLLPLLSQGPGPSKGASGAGWGPLLLPHTQVEEQKAAKVEGENELSWQLTLLKRWPAG